MKMKNNTDLNSLLDVQEYIADFKEQSIALCFDVGFVSADSNTLTGVRAYSANNSRTPFVMAYQFARKYASNTTLTFIDIIEGEDGVVLGTLYLNTDGIYDYSFD